MISTLRDPGRHLGPQRRVWAAVVCLIAVAVIAARVAYGPQPIRALWTGSVGSWYALTSGTLVRAVPLMLCGLAVTAAFRAGVLNIGADGQFLLGAIAATVVATQGHAWPAVVLLPTALIAGVLAGSAWAGIAAVLRLRFGVFEVISTLMLNFVAADWVSYLVRGPLQEPKHIYPQSPDLPLAAHLPRFGETTRLHWGLVIALALALLTAWLIARTASGFRLRAVGANPDAAVTTGRISVSRVSAWAFLLSGGLAGLAGAIEVTGVTYALYENLSPGYGFTAIAVAILAGLRPVGVLATAVLFAAMETGATAMQRDAGVPAAWASVVEASLILVVIAAVGSAFRHRTGEAAT